MTSTKHIWQCTKHYCILSFTFSDCNLKICCYRCVSLSLSLSDVLSVLRQCWRVLVCMKPCSGRTQVKDNKWHTGDTEETKDQLLVHRLYLCPCPLLCSQSRHTCHCMCARVCVCAKYSTEGATSFLWNRTKCKIEWERDRMQECSVHRRSTDKEKVKLAIFTTLCNILESDKKILCAKQSSSLTKALDMEPS